MDDILKKIGYDELPEEKKEIVERSIHIKLVLLQTMLKNASYDIEICQKRIFESYKDASVSGPINLVVLYYTLLEPFNVPLYIEELDETNPPVYLITTNRRSP